MGHRVCRAGSSRKTKTVGYQDAIGEVGQYHCDVERHLVIAEAAVIARHKEASHEPPYSEELCGKWTDPSRAVRPGSEMEGGNRPGLPSKEFWGKLPPATT